MGVLLLIILAFVYVPNWWVFAAIVLLMIEGSE
jgi:hypothetical protein